MSTTMDRFIAFIPARGGSKGIKRKNLALINGVPLLVHALRQVAALAPETIFVSTEDAEIESVTRLYADTNPFPPVVLIPRPSNLFNDQATIDDVVADFITIHQPTVPVLVWQPTVVGVNQARIAGIIENFLERPHLPEAWTMLRPVRHIIWEDQENMLSRRVNRQDMDGPFEEVGVRLYPPGHTDPPAFGWVQDGVVDIDTLGDLTDAQQSTKQLVFQVMVSQRVGSGHLRRCLALAAHLQQYDIQFILSGDRDFWVRDLLDKSGWKYEWMPTDWKHDNPNGVWVFDMLNTSRRQVSARIAEGWKTVTLEDLGGGAKLADITVNAMYPPPSDWWDYHPYRHLVGVKYHVFRPEFTGIGRIVRSQHRPLERILVTFGGTDPSMLTERITDLLNGRALPNVEHRVVSPPGRPVSGAMQKVPIAAELAQADLVITSAGQTLYEAALLGTPALVLSQSFREATHVGLGYGNLHLGVGDLVSNQVITETLDHLVRYPEVRATMAEVGKRSIDDRGALRIARRIEDLMEGL